MTNEIKQNWAKDGSPGPTNSRYDLRRLAWLPIPLLLVSIAALWAADLRTPYESLYLLTGLNFVFVVVTSLCISFLIGRSFLVSGMPGLLMLCCGTVCWGAAGITGIAAGLMMGAGQLDINTFITIHNVCVWLSALCHLVGAVISLQSRWTVIDTRNLWLAAGFGVTLGTVWLVTQSALASWMPPFFVQGQGGTLVRTFVLGSAMIMFTLTAVLLWAANRHSLSPFIYWYALALLLIAAGLLGILIESVHANMLSWAGRIGQFLGGAYMFIAAIASMRESGVQVITLGQALTEARYRYGVAIASVIAAAVVRLVFLQALGMRNSYLTFYPAVMLAALYGGLQSGLLATAFSALLVDYLWIEPVGQLSIGHPADWLGMAVFLMSCMIITFITEAMHRAKARASKAEAETELTNERKQAKEALRESQRQNEFLGNILEHSSQPFGVGYPDGRLGLVNRAFERLTGYNGTELRLMDWVTTLTPPEWQKREHEKLDELLHTGQPVRYEKEYIRKDGSRVPIELLVHLKMDSLGKPEYFYSFITDITERKQTEQAQRESERRLAEIVERSPSFVCILRGPDHVFELANDKYFQIIGRRNIIGKKLSDALPEISATPYPQILDRVFQTGKPFSANDVSLKLARGMNGQLEEVWLEFVYLPLRESDGSVSGIFVHGIDITGRKKSEERIRKLNEDLGARNKELEFANKEMESFVYSISHDLRGPLRAISGFSSMLFQGIADDCLDDKRRNYLNRIQLGASKMSRLIDDLLRLSHISRQEMIRTEVNLSSLAAAIIAELQESNADRKVDIKIKEGSSALADLGLIKIVLSNLLGNAWKFTSKTENAQIEFATVDEGGKTVFYVKDNGAGFNQEYANKMFAPFHRLHRSEEFEGTGIGLAIVERIIRRHGGKIWAEGEDKKGATILFKLG